MAEGHEQENLRLEMQAEGRLRMTLGAMRSLEFSRSKDKLMRIIITTIANHYMLSNMYMYTETNIYSTRYYFKYFIYISLILKNLHE